MDSNKQRDASSTSGVTNPKPQLLTGSFAGLKKNGQVLQRIQQEEQSFQEDEDSLIFRDSSEVPAAAKGKVSSGQFLSWSLLTITVKSGQDLKKMDVFSKSDAYVEVEFRKKKMSSDFVSNNLNPKWNKKFHFVIGQGDDASDFTDLGDYITFTVSDFNNILANNVIGHFKVQLDDLLRQPKGAELLGVLEPSPLSVVNASKRATIDGPLGIIKYSYTLRNLNSQASIERPLPSEKQQEINQLINERLNDPLYVGKALTGVMKQHSKGILQVHIMNIEGMEKVPQYEVEIKVASDILDALVGGKKRVEKSEVVEKKKGNDQHLQLMKPNYLPIEGQFETGEISFIIRKTGGFKKTQLAIVNCKLQHALDLLQPGNPSILVEFDQFIIDKEGQEFFPAGTTSRPKLIASLCYHNSLFTQLSKGLLCLKLNSWNFNGSAFPPDFYLSLKVGTEKERSIKKRFEEVKFQLTAENMLETLSITLSQDKAFQRDPTITKTELRVFELFTSNDSTHTGNIVYQSTIHRVEYEDIDRQCDMALAISSTFKPSGLTPEQEKALADQHDLWRQKVFKDSATHETETLEQIVHKQSQEADFFDDEDDDIHEMNLDGSSKSGKRDVDELASLSISEQTLPKYSQNPRGILLLRLKGMLFEAEEGTGKQSSPAKSFTDVLKVSNVKIGQKNEPSKERCYVLFKTSRMTLRTKSVIIDFSASYANLFSDIIHLKIGDKAEKVDVSVMKETGPDSDDIAIFQGKIIVPEIIGTSWKKISDGVQLQPSLKNSSLFNGLNPLLKFDAQYRYSKFTRMPHGRLEVILVKGSDMKNKNEGFLPIMEFRLGNQRVKVDERVNPIKAVWSQRTLEFETHGLWDEMEVRLYHEEELRVGLGGLGTVDGSSKVFNLNLLGSFNKPLSSIFFDDDNASIIDIDLKNVNPELSGQIRVQFEYYPNAVGQEIEKAQLNTQQQQTSAENKDNASQNIDKRQGICHMSLIGMQVVGIPPDSNYSVENIRLELTYGQQRCLSKITTDLQKTGNKEVMKDQFRFSLKEFLNRPNTEKHIQIKAYDIDFAANFNDNLTHVLIGESQIDTIAIRKNQGVEFHYRCGIQISQEHFSKRAEKGVDDENDIGEIIAAKQETAQLNDLIARGKKLADQVDKQEAFTEKNPPEVVLTFQIFFIITPFTRQPLGLVTISDMALLNLENFIDKFARGRIEHIKSNNANKECGQSWGNSGIYIEMKMLKNKSSSEDAKFCQTLEQADENHLSRDSMCLFNQEYDPIEVMKSGRSFYVRSSSLGSRSYYKFRDQLVLHTASSEDDQLEIKVIWELPQALLSNEQQSAGAPIREVLASSTLRVSDLSYFTIGQPSSQQIVPLALLLDFHPSEQLYAMLGLQKSLGSSIFQSGESAANILKSHLNLGSKDLSNKFYSRNLILLFDLKFISNDQFEESKQLNGLIRADNVYVMPQEIKYDDFINNQFEELAKKKGLRKTNQSESADSSQRRQMLVEVELQNLNSMIRGLSQNAASHPYFACIEPLTSQEDSVKSYVQVVVDQFLVATKQQQSQKLQAAAADISLSMKQGNETTTLMKRLRTMGYGQELMEMELLAPVADIVRPEVQMSQYIYKITDYELNPVNTHLEAWVPVNTSRLMLSVIMQNNGDSDQVESFRQLILQRGLSHTQNVLSLHRLGMMGLLQDIETAANMPPSFRQIRIYQALIDLKQNASVADYCKQVFKQSCNLSELALYGQQNHLLCSPMSLSSCQIQTKIMSSKFIDTPSGLLNVIFKKMTFNSDAWKSERYFIKLSLKSAVSRDKIVGYQNQADLIKEAYNTQLLSFYKLEKKSPQAKKTSVNINSAQTFLLRHYSDILVLQIYHVHPSQQNAADEANLTGDIVFSTKVELNNIELNEDKMSIMVVGTSPMSKASSSMLRYFTFELDLSFKVRLAHEPPPDPFDIALRNYRMMKQQHQQSGGGVVKVSKAEEGFIRMMIDRVALAKQLTPARMKMRKAFFTVRNMKGVVYRPILTKEVEQTAMYLRVNPKSFLMGSGYGLADASTANRLSAIQEQDVVKELRQELMRSEADYKQAVFKYADIPLDKSTPVDKHNVLSVEFIQTPQVGSTQVSLASKYKKLVFIATQEQQTVLKKEIPLSQNSSDDVLSGLKVFFKNVQNDFALTFRIQAQPITQSETKNQKGGPGEALVPLGMAIVKVAQLGLVSWAEVQKTFPLNGASPSSSLNSLTFKALLMHSDFTKNPSKVLSVNFHRVLYLPQSQSEVASSGLVKVSKAIQLESSKGQNSKIILRETPIFSKALALPIAGMMMQTMKQQTTQNHQAGSINEQLAKVEQEDENATAAGSVMMRMEFDNCIEYEGPVDGGDKKDYELNQYGKTPLLRTKELNRVKINNMKYDAQVKFKLCVGQPGDQRRKNKQEAATVAEASFHLAQVQSMPNQQLNFFIPLKLVEQSAESGGISQSWIQRQYKFPADGLYVLASICITDKTFGELTLNIDRFESIPRHIPLREIQWRMHLVTAKQMLLSNGAPTAGGKQENDGIIKKYVSERIEYDIGMCKELEIDHELSIHLQMKDIFSGVGGEDGFSEEALNPRLTNLHADQDMYLLLELIGFDDNNQVEYVLGEKQYTIIQLIQRQILSEREQLKATQFALAHGGIKPTNVNFVDTASRASKEQHVEMRAKDLEQQASKKVQSDFSGTSAKFQALFKDSYVKFNQSKDSLIQKRLEQQQTVKEANSKAVNDAGFTGLENLEYQEKNLIQIDNGEEISPMKKQTGNNGGVRLDIPEGFRVIQFKLPKMLQDQQKSFTLLPTDEHKLTELANKIVQRQILPQPQSDNPALIAKIEFSFSYKKKMQHSQSYLEAKEELRQLERLRQKKNIGNILDTLTSVMSQSSSIMFKTLRRLGFVLATQSPSVNISLSLRQTSGYQRDEQDDIDDEEEFLKTIGESANDGSRQALSNIERIIEVMAELVKTCLAMPSGGAGNDINVFMEIMRVLTYLKIICSQQGLARQMKRYKDAIEKSLLLETLIESYLQRGSYAGTSFKSAVYTIDFLAFVTTQIAEFPELYFKAMCGENLSSLLTQTIAVGKDNAVLVMAYARFLDALAQCLLKRQKKKQEKLETVSLTQELQEKLLQVDTARVLRAVDDQIQNIIKGLQVYKNAYEAIASTLTSTGIQIVHELMIDQASQRSEGQIKLIAEADRGIVSRILTSILKVLVDSVISETSTSFVEDLKRRLTYEIGLATTLRAESGLQLSFDSGEVLGMLKALLIKFSELQEENAFKGKLTGTLLQAQQQQVELRGLKLFERMRVVLEFFATATGNSDCTSNQLMNVFGENNRELIGKVIRNAKAAIAGQEGDSDACYDFMVFLENVVRADHEIEDENESAAVNKTVAKTQKDRAAFFAEKYGGATEKGKQSDVNGGYMQNKFSLTRIEWLDNVFIAEQ